MLALRLPRTGTWRTWVNAQIFSAGHALAAGVVLCVLTWLWCKLPVRRWALPMALALFLAWIVAVVALKEDLEGIVARLSEWMPVAVAQALLSLLPAIAAPTAYLVGRALKGSALRIVGVLAALLTIVANAVVLPLAYPGVHLWVLCSCALALAGVTCGAPLPTVASKRWARGLVFVACAAAGAASLAVWPPNATVVEMAHQPAATFMPFLARLRTQAATPFRVPPGQREWFVERSRLPDVKSGGPLLRQDAVVLMIGVDSMRSDLLENDKYRDVLPNMFRLRDRGTWFKNARAAGSSTAPSIAAIFSSRYYSQMYWTEYTKRQPEVFPHEDPTPRFPELLSAAGVQTVTVDTAGWLLNEFAIVRGFSEESSARIRGYPTAAEAAKGLHKRLREHGDGALFLFTHFLDAHSPYTSAGKSGSPFDGYLAEVALVDSEIGALQRTVDQAGLSQRSVWVLYSDHGEAFGEHGMTFHATTLYDELLRVPLVFAGAGIVKRSVETPVSLVDVGPTILDAFGVNTPAAMMGQSLVPFLRGGTASLTRPILAESRLKRALVTAEGFKVFEDPRRKTIELYDLNKDPGELNNIFDHADPQSQDAIGVLATFFSVHTYKRPGYTVPYRKW